MKRKFNLPKIVPNKYRYAYGTVLIFAVAGTTMLLLTQAATSSVVYEPENATLASGATQVADSNASGGKSLRFGSVSTAPPTPPPQPPAPGSMPTKQWLLDNAGPYNEAILRASGSVTITTNGAVVQDLDIAGTVTVNADNVTLKNCKVRGYTSTFVVRLASGHKNLTVDHCSVEAIPNSSGDGANGALGADGSTSGMVVRNSEILGYADGIKAADGSLYEYNYIHMFKPSGSAKHLDGIQGSGDSNWTAQYNLLMIGIEAGGNFSLFAQGFNGTICKKIVNVEFSSNYIYGGNYGMQFAGGKSDVCADPGSYGENLRAYNNVFLNDPDGLGKSDSNKLGFRYGYIDTQNVSITKSGNKLENGTPVN